MCYPGEGSTLVTGGGQSGEAVTSGEHCCGRDAQKCRGTGDWALLFCLTPSSGIEARTDGRSPGLQVSATRSFPRALPTCVLSPLTSLLNAQALQNGKKMFNVLLGDDENGCCSRAHGKCPQSQLHRTLPLWLAHIMSRVCVSVSRERR